MVGICCGSMVASRKGDVSTTFALCRGKRSPFFRSPRSVSSQFIGMILKKKKKKNPSISNVSLFSSSSSSSWDRNARIFPQLFLPTKHVFWEAPFHNYPLISICSFLPIELIWCIFQPRFRVFSLQQVSISGILLALVHKSGLVSWLELSTALLGIRGKSFVH